MFRSVVQQFRVVLGNAERLGLVIATDEERVTRVIGNLRKRIRLISDERFVVFIGTAGTDEFVGEHMKTTLEDYFGLLEKPARVVIALGPNGEGGSN